MYERPRVDYGAGPLVMLSVVEVPPGKTYVSHQFNVHLLNIFAL